jgi:hypothetical protein
MNAPVTRESERITTEDAPRRGNGPAGAVRGVADPTAPGRGASALLAELEQAPFY